MPERKAITVELKADDEGALVALFSTYNVVDHDGDIVVPGAFEDGAEVPIGAWGHNTRALPSGKGRIVDGSDGARLDGRLFLDSSGGHDMYATLKGLGKVAEWSYIYEPREWEHEQRDGQDVRLLKKIDVWSVDPVLRGAGIGTQTELIKAYGLLGFPNLIGITQKPYPNEHACRLRDPGAFQPDSFRRMQRQHDGKRYIVIVGRLKGETTTTEQAYRYPKDTWNANEARSHCRSHDGRFEAARSSAGYPCVACDDGEFGFLTYANQVEHALAAVLALEVRTKELAALRAKEGRMLSMDNRERLHELLDSLTEAHSGIEALLKEADPNKTDIDVLALYAEHQRMMQEVRR